ncbi:MAG: monofunctional biosynthetic peptidoglycan transglycosylase [Burkholderiaceae bacterium]
MKTWSRWLGRAVAVAVGLVLLLQLYYFGCIGWYRHHDPSNTAFMRSHMALVTEKNPAARIEHRWVPYARISDNLKRAVITSEDARFAEHDGVDWDAISKAYENNEKVGANLGKGKRQPARIKGGSTITQQLAKNLFLSGERSYLRKGQELVITYMLEFWLSKQRILEIYLNVIEWGNGVFGAEAAAHHYFGTTAAQLGPSQAAQLAVMLPNPRFYDTRRGSPYLARRSAVITRWMGDAELP